MIHSPSWWNDLEANQTLSPWLENTSLYAKKYLINALENPTNKAIILSPYQSTIQQWSLLSPDEWTRIQSSLQDIFKTEHLITQNLFRKDPADWNQHIFFSLPILQRFNQYNWFHQPWTILSLYTQPASTFLIPFLLLIIPLLILKLRGISFPWHYLRSHFWNLLLYACGSDLFQMRGNYHPMTLGFLLVKRWISIGIYLYGVWSSIRHSIELQGYASQIANEFRTLRQWITQMKTLTESLPDGDLKEKYLKEFQQQENWIQREFNKIHQWADYKHFWFPTRWLKPAQCWTLWHKWERTRDKLNTMMVNVGQLLAIIHLAKLIREQDSEKTPLCFPTWNPKKKHTWKEAWHPTFKGETPVLQSYTYQKKRRFWLIMGANASGKTTFLKTASWIYWMSQAWGIAPCQSANLKWIDHFWSWVRVPDATGRESLFEAEVRRAREIMNALSQMNDKGETAWVWMDEVFGSTNVKESTACAYATLKTCMNEYPNLMGGSTTHLHGLWKLKRLPQIHLMAFMMEKQNEDNQWKPTYQYKTGVKAQELALEWVKQKGEMPEVWLNAAEEMSKKL